MKKALKVTQSGKNGKSYFYVEKEALQNDMTTKIVWVRISEQEASEMLKNEHVVSDMTFKGDNMTTIYCVTVEDVLNTEVQESEQIETETVKTETVKTETVKTIFKIESDITSILKEIESIDLMIHESKIAGNSNVIINYMNQQDALCKQLAELKHKQLVLNVKSA